MPDNGWTIRSLKEYVDERFRSANIAIDKASHALDARLESMNLFRAQILEERVQLLTKEEYEQRHASLEARLDVARGALESRLAALERWQSKIIGALALVIFLTPLVTALLVWVITNHNAP